MKLSKTVSDPSRGLSLINRHLRAIRVILKEVSDPSRGLSLINHAVEAENVDDLHSFRPLSGIKPHQFGWQNAMQKN